MIEMKQGKRIHRVNLSFDDAAFCHLSHLAMYERKDLATFVHDVVIEKLYGLTTKLPKPCTEEKE